MKISFSHPSRVRQIVIQLVSHSWERMGDFSASVNTEDGRMSSCICVTGTFREPHLEYQVTGGNWGPLLAFLASLIRELRMDSEGGLRTILLV